MAKLILDDDILFLFSFFSKILGIPINRQVLRGMTELTPSRFDADPARLPPTANPRSDRREAHPSLRMAQPRSEPGTVQASLQEIRKILRDSDNGGKDATQPQDEPVILIRSAPTGDEPREPRKEETSGLFARAFAPLVAPPLRRDGSVRAVLAVAVLALLGAMSFMVARGMDLSNPAASARGKGAPRADDRLQAVARAALPPAPPVEVARSDATRLPPATPQHPDASLATAAAIRVNPRPEPRTPTAAPVIPPAPHARAADRRSGSGFRHPPVAVMQWELRSGNRDIASAGRHVPLGRPLILRIVFDGNLAAAEQIRSRGGIPIEVRWTRETSDTALGAPNLATRLTIGNRRLAGALSAEARRTGFFVWHSWAEKSALSPGTWNVSLTYPNGQPLACGNPPAPCRFHIAVGSPAAR
jgi:hypothetical protein